MQDLSYNQLVAIGADHAGFEMKKHLIRFLSGLNIPYKDFGTFTSEATDYADIAHPVAAAVENKEASLGILLCGSANGMAITANKHPQIRAAICWEEEIAVLARKHNNANVLCIPARFIGNELAEKLLAVFLHTPFEGGRHTDRINKIPC